MSNETAPKFRVIDINAEVRKLYGPEWNKPEVVYEFSNGRKFEQRIEDFGPYDPS